MEPYEKLEAWQFGHRLVLAVYRTTKNWPEEERYSLTKQVRRAAYSAPANIVEGSAKRGRREFARFLDIAIDSLAEVGYGLRVGHDLGYTTVPEHEELAALHKSASRLTTRLYQAISGRGKKTR